MTILHPDTAEISAALARVGARAVAPGVWEARLSNGQLLRVVAPDDMIPSLTGVTPAWPPAPAPFGRRLLTAAQRAAVRAVGLARRHPTRTGYAAVAVAVPAATFGTTAAAAGPTVGLVLAAAPAALGIVAALPLWLVRRADRQAVVIAPEWLERDSER